VSARGDREHPAFAGTSLFNFIAAPTSELDNED
jgi:hypothetical protein